MRTKALRSIIGIFQEYAPAYECWNWPFYLDLRGYGRISYYSKNRMAHRVVYEIMVGPTRGLQIHHICNNKKCVNPSHLKAMDASAHWRIGNSYSAQHARKVVCKHGHPLTPENVWLRRRGHGWERHCRACGNIRSRAYRKRLASH